MNKHFFSGVFMLSVGLLLLLFLIPYGIDTPKKSVSRLFHQPITLRLLQLFCQ